MNSSTEREVPIPASILDNLLTSEAVSSAHHNLCNAIPNNDTPAPLHPGDPLGRTMAWLWSIGESYRCANLAADYLAEMRMHNPHSQEDNRLIWKDLKQGIGYATSIALNSNQIEELIMYLDDQVPRTYGAAPKRLNIP